MSSLKTTIAATLIVALFSLSSSPYSWAEDSDTLIFLHYWTGTLSGGIDEMAQTFNQDNPDTKVKPTGFEHESFKVGINVMLSSGTPPDMFSYWAGAKVRDLVDYNHLATIDDVWDKAKLNRIFPPAVAQACTYYSHKYALPLTQHYVGFFYNKGIFNRHNIAPPTTWDEFLGVCRSLKASGVPPISLGSRERWPAQFWFDYLLLKTAGPEFRNALMEGRASYTDPKVKKAFTIWKDLLNLGYFNTSPNQLNWSEAAKQVYSGKAAMTLMGTWIIGLYDGKLGWKQEEDYDFFPFPVMDETVPQTSLGPIDAIVVPRKGNPEKVKKALAFFSTPGPQMEMSLGSGALSPSMEIPQSFYTPLQQRILDVIRATPNWAFNYDLATPPAVAEHGLDGLKQFINTPDNYEQILTDIERKTRTAFGKARE